MPIDTAWKVLTLVQVRKEHKDAWDEDVGGFDNAELSAHVGAIKAGLCEYVIFNDSLLKRSRSGPTEPWSYMSWSGEIWEETPPF